MGGTIVPVAATLTVTCAFAFASMSTLSDPLTGPHDSAWLNRFTFLSNVRGGRFENVWFTSIVLFVAAAKLN